MNYVDGDCRMFTQYVTASQLSSGSITFQNTGISKPKGAMIVADISSEGMFAVNIDFENNKMIRDAHGNMGLVLTMPIPFTFNGDTVTYTTFNASWRCNTRITIWGE